MRRHWFVSGRVQGVWFRVETRNEAARIGGISGFVRNLRDGRVEVEAEGEPEALDQLEGWLQHGPPNARVDDLVACEPGTAPLGAFEILGDAEAG